MAIQKAGAWSTAREKQESWLQFCFAQIDSVTGPPWLPLKHSLDSRDEMPLCDVIYRIVFDFYWLDLSLKCIENEQFFLVTDRLTFIQR